MWVWNDSNKRNKRLNSSEFCSVFSSLFQIAICDYFNVCFLFLRSFPFYHIQWAIFVRILNGMFISRRQEYLSMKYFYFLLFFVVLFSRKKIHSNCSLWQFLLSLEFNAWLGIRNDNSPVIHDQSADTLISIWTV